MSETSSSSPTAEKKQVSFTTFVLSLSAAALQHLGTPVREIDKPCINLALARESIEILEMLQLKTAGNLTQEEDQLLATLLYDLRMRYVKVAASSGCPE